MKNVLNINTLKKENIILKKMTEFYRNSNAGQISIPPFMLADIELRNLKKEGRINEVYNLLKKQRKLA